MRYGFIGLGHLGGHLAASLLRAGFAVTVHDRDRALAERHIDAGAAWAGSPESAAEGADALITCLPSPAVSEAVLRAALPTMAPGSTWIEMSTLGRDDILRLAALAGEFGVATLESPVTGGVHLARSGQITVLAGGPAPRRWATGCSTWGRWDRPQSSRSSPTCWPSSIWSPMARR